MKYIKIFFIISILGLVSCEDFLDKSPDLGLTEQTVYKDYKSITGYLDNCYANLLNTMCMEMYNNGRAYIDLISDELATTDNSSAALGFHSGNWLNQTKNSDFEVGVTDNTPISKSYKSLRIANRVLANYETVPGLTDEQKNAVGGQAYFYRAWYYFELIRRYGGMPIFDKVFVGDGDQDLPRVTYHESTAWMISDLDKAIAMLPDSWDDANSGRPSKVMAMALKEMALLYDASPLMQNDLNTIEIKEYDKERAKLAAQAATAVLRYVAATPQANCRLMTKDEYKNIFYFAAPPYAMPEYIWYCRRVENAANQNQKRTIRTYWLPSSLAQGTGVDGASFHMPTQNMVDLFEAKGLDGKYYPISNPKSGYDPQNPWVNRDPRFTNDILIPGEKWGFNGNKQLYITMYEGGGIANEIKTLSVSNKRQSAGYMCKKFIWPEANQYYPNDAGWNLYRIITVYIRMAQIYLDFAEASFEATGSATAKVEGCDLSAAEALNIVRARVGVTPVPDEIVNDPAQFREAYRRERTVELMFENHRWWDLRRWMIAHEVFKATYPIKGMKATPLNPNHNTVVDKSTLKFSYQVVDVTSEVRKFDMRNYWYPFPQSDVASMKNLKQNPGW